MSENNAYFLMRGILFFVEPPNPHCKTRKDGRENWTGARVEPALEEEGEQVIESLPKKQAARRRLERRDREPAEERERR